MEAALGGCRKTLVSTGQAISLLLSTNEHRNHSCAFVGASFLALYSFQSEGAFAGQRALTIESSPPYLLPGLHFA